MIRIQGNSDGLTLSLQHIKLELETFSLTSQSKIEIFLRF